MTLPSSWHADWSNLSAVVLGLGKSGFSVVDTLVELGVKTFAIGKEADPKLVELTEVIGSEFLQTEDPEVFAKLGQLDFAVVSQDLIPAIHWWRNSANAPCQCLRTLTWLGI